MVIGIDIGGTNTDIVWIDSEIHTGKVPNTNGLSGALSRIPSGSRLSVSTSLPLNSLSTEQDYNVRTITIPGPGLVYGGAVRGAVGHRGEILEPVNPDEIEDLIKNCHADSIAIAGKFSPRNAELEEEVRDIVLKYFSDDRIATSAPLGELNFPARITTTRINAQIKPHIWSITKSIRRFFPEFRYVTSTGGLIGPERALDNPSQLYRSSPATVVIGAFYLTKRTDCLVVDIGGTTTDLVPIRKGKPVLEQVVWGDKPTMIRSVTAVTIPAGGDSCVREDGCPFLCSFRVGNARAFGGGEPTLTDALNVLGSSIGNRERSDVISPQTAKSALSQYQKIVSENIRKINPGFLVGSGFLAPYLLPDIAGILRIPYEIPNHCGSTNAIGAAVSRISILLHAHADSEKGVMTMNGTEYHYPARMDDESLVEYAGDLVRNLARTEGAPEEDTGDLVIERFSAYNVVRGGRISSRIADFVIGIEPGISAEAP